MKKLAFKYPIIQTALIIATVCGAKMRAQTDPHANFKHPSSLATTPQPASQPATPSKPIYYKHKVTIDSIQQTPKYTYLKLREKLANKDSLVWVALPVVSPKIGETYYYQDGLKMGTFQSKELKRTFNQIVFLANLGTTPEITYDNVIPAPVKEQPVANQAPAKLHTVTVKEVIQTSGYSYLRVKEENKEEWLAVVKVPAQVGQKFTYTDAAPMKNFFSKELKRTFDEVLFVSKLSYAQ